MAKPLPTFQQVSLHRQIVRSRPITDGKPAPTFTPNALGGNTPMDTRKSQLLGKLTSRNAHVAIIGLGYVGLPLAVVFAEAGYRVTGVDLDQSKVDAVNSGESYIEDVSS